MSDVLWNPTPEAIASSRMQAFHRHVTAAHGLSQDPDDLYRSLYRWSLEEPAAFWRAVWDFCDVIGEPGVRPLVDGDRMPGARWFPDAKLSFAENLLRRRDDTPAMIFRREDGRRRVLTFAETHEEVQRLRRAFRDEGLQPGDRVAAYLPNIPEAITAMLAATSLGGIWSSCSPDFGVSGVLDRFGQVDPKILLSVDGYPHKGQRFEQRDKLAEVVDGLPGLRRTVVLGYTRPDPELADIRDVARWDDWVPAPAAPEAFERFPFDQPLYILFSSGTTGKPKCIVHGAGGTLLQHLKEHRLHTDLRPGDRLFYFTTTGWMMWNWLVTGLASEATLVLHDGNPMYPSQSALLDMAQEEKVTVFGTSAKYIDALKKAGLKPRETHDLSALRTICSTGSPLLPESFDYVYEDVKRDVQLASIAGGTDIVSCFMLGCPVRPVRRSEIQCRGLGMAVEVWDDDGRPLLDRPGELVCVKPFPSMPVSFWDDPDDARYRSAYFEHYPGVWRHGDWCRLTPADGIVVYGRSDATLNPGGVRIGTAEIYRAVEQFPEVEEAIVVGQDWEGDQRIILFVRLAEGHTLDEDLAGRIRRHIRATQTPRHLPKKILAVTDIPRTRSGKISEVAVREVIHGRPVKNTEALANPEALQQFRDRPELRD
ncbi:MAG: acetoacetate--CoA ligase [Acidobacteriota bacterium]|jgi:acetoacetyl-CoA synthetase